MSEEHNAALVRRAVEEIWNRRDLDVADVLFAPDYVNHGGLIPDLVCGPETVKISVALYRTAFPDLHVTVEDVSAEGETVVLRWTARNRARSGVQEALAGITRSRLAGGQIAESWTSWDSGGVLRHLDLTPLTGPPGPETVA